MANYAFLDENNIVVNVIAGIDEDITQKGVGGSSEAWETFYGNEVSMRCARTSYNTIENTHRNGGTPFRKNFAQIGFKYDEIGFFNPEKPFASWTFDSETYSYNPPIPKPIKNEKYQNWNKEAGIWEEIHIPWILDYKWNELEQKWEMVAFRIKNGVQEFFLPENPRTSIGEDGTEIMLLAY